MTCHPEIWGLVFLRTHISLDKISKKRTLTQTHVKEQIQNSTVSFKNIVLTSSYLIHFIKQPVTPTMNRNLKHITTNKNGIPAKFSTTKMRKARQSSNKPPASSITDTTERLESVMNGTVKGVLTQAKEMFPDTTIVQSTLTLTPISKKARNTRNDAPWLDHIRPCNLSPTYMPKAKKGQKKPIKETAGKAH